MPGISAHSFQHLSRDAKRACQLLARSSAALNRRWSGRSAKKPSRSGHYDVLEMGMRKLNSRWGTSGTQESLQIPGFLCLKLRFLNN